MNNMKRKSRLGKGLSSIFNINSKNQSEINNHIKSIDINLIEKNPYQPRTKISNKELQELSNSIKTYGLIQPITVREKHQNSYELISGERRLRASILAGIEKIPVFIKNIKTNEMLEVALVENIQREDLDPIEIALSLKHLIHDYQFTHDSLAKKIGKNRSTISNYIRLLRLDPLIQAGIRDKIITMGHAKAILNIDNLETQINLYQNIIQNRLSVRETEKIVKKNNFTQIKINRKKILLSNHYQKIEKNLSDFFNQKITLIISKNGKGKIEIPFNSENKVDEILKLLQ